MSRIRSDRSIDRSTERRMRYNNMIRSKLWQFHSSHPRSHAGRSHGNCSTAARTQQAAEQQQLKELNIKFLCLPDWTIIRSLPALDRPTGTIAGAIDPIVTRPRLSPHPRSQGGRAFESIDQQATGGWAVGQVGKRHPPPLALAGEDRAEGETRRRAAALDLREVDGSKSRLERSIPR